MERVAPRAGVGNERPELLISIGIPGSGKSTYFRDNNPSGKTVINPDSIRKELTGNISDQSKNAEVWALTYRRLENSLRNNKDTILDATNVNKRTVDEIIKRFTGIALLKFKFFECSPELAKDRISEDIKRGVDRSHVPNDVIDRMYFQYIDTKRYILSIFDRSVIEL